MLLPDAPAAAPPLDSEVGPVDTAISLNTDVKTRAANGHTIPPAVRPAKRAPSMHFTPPYDSLHVGPQTEIPAAIGIHLRVRACAIPPERLGPYGPLEFGRAPVIPADTIILLLGHLLAIGVVAAQAWLGLICPLTTWEMGLRDRAGAETYSGAFIAQWLERLLYYRAPDWLFILAYSLFALGVLATWVWVRPRSFGHAARLR